MTIIKASTAVMSRLSDSQELISFVCGSKGTDKINYSKFATDRINFAKFIIMRCDGDLNKEIDADALYTEFLNQ